MHIGIARRLAALLTIAAFALIGCAEAEDAAEDHAPIQESGALAIADPWIKATDTEMTGVFGTIENTGDEPLRIVAADAELAGMVELHETITQSDGSSVMQEVEGGFTIPAGEELALEPGGNHIMLMDLDREILPGDEIVVTVTTADGAEHEFTAQAKEYTGAQETYAPDSEHGDHGGH